LRDARLDRVNEELIVAYVARRRAMKKRNGKPLTVATVNRESQRYVHPTAERIESAFTMLESCNAEQERKLKDEQE
jgi:hypothetical protein